MILMSYEGVCLKAGETRIFAKVYCTAVFDVEGCDFVPLPVEGLGLHQQNQLELGKTFRETFKKAKTL